MGAVVTVFQHEVGETYTTLNRRALEWMLARPRLRAGLINTKLNSLTLVDYGPSDGLRGPDYVYGWIQGRALEAMVCHAAAFSQTYPELSRRLIGAAKPIYRWLCATIARGGHVSFCHGPDDEPIRPGTNGEPVFQKREPGLFGYSDIFAAKGLVAMAARMDLPELDRHLDYLDAIVASIEEGRFQMNEREDIRASVIAGQPDDFGPRMIALGAASMLGRLGLGKRSRFAEPMIERVLSGHLDPSSGLLRNNPGAEATNPGHAIEFTAFALDVLGQTADPDVRATLLRILRQSYRVGRAGPGIAVAADIKSARADTSLFPWWTLPEAIRAAAIAFDRTGETVYLDIWRDADAAFLAGYWRSEPPIAIQSRNLEGPIDIVPATPDLDPGYHTGLCLLDAARISRRQTPKPR